MKPNLHRYLAGLVCVSAGYCLTFLPFAQAQQPAAALDPKVLKQYESILTHKFSRDLNDIFYALERTGTADAHPEPV